NREPFLIRVLFLLLRKLYNLLWVVFVILQRDWELRGLRKLSNSREVGTISRTSLGYRAASSVFRATSLNFARRPQYFARRACISRGVLRKSREDPLISRGAIKKSVHPFYHVDFRQPPKIVILKFP